MFIQTEDPIIVKSDPFEHSITVKQTMIEDGNLGLSLVVEISVNVDFKVHSEGFKVSW
jgi:hypothetical protein